MEQAESVGLRHLREPEDAAQFVGRRGNPDRKKRVASLGRRDQMAHRADTADTRHQRGHLVEWPPFAQFLKAAELRYVEARILDAAILIQVQRDLRMAFNASHRLDDDGI